MPAVRPGNITKSCRSRKCLAAKQASLVFIPGYVWSHTHKQVFVCERWGYAQKTVWLPKTHHLYNRTIALFLLKTFILVISWYVCQVEYLRSWLFLTFFRYFLCGGTPHSQTESRHVYNVGITNDVNVYPMSKNDDVWLLGLNLGLSHDVCEPMVGSVVKDSWRTNQERAVLHSFSKNTPRAMVVLF